MRYLPFSLITGAFCLLGLSSATIAAGVSQTPLTIPEFSPAEVSSDLDTCYRTLRESSYNLYAYTSKADYDAEYDRIKKELSVRKGPLNEMEVDRLFLRFTVLARIGHLSVQQAFYDAYNRYKMADGTLFPFGVRIEGQRGFIKSNYSGNASLDPGDEILSMNGKPFSSYLLKIYELVPGENDYMKSTVVDMAGFPRSLWEAYGRQDTFALIIQKAETNAKLEVNVNAISALDFDKIDKGVYNALTFDREFKFIDDHTAYYRPGIFLNMDSGGGTSDHKTFETGEFLQVLDSSFQQMHLRHTENVIIDLRGNPGGDDSFSYPMVAYFASKPFSFCSRFSVKTSELTKKFWEGVTDPHVKEIRSEILSHKNGETFDTPVAVYQPRADSLKFTGHVYVLINRHSYSEATTVPAMIQDYGFGKIVGEATSQSPTLYAAEHDFSLPNTKLVVTYTKAYMVRSNGSTSTGGVIPDYPFQDDGLGKEDKTLNYTLKLIREGKY
jgi:hypothetical protein